VWQFCANVMVDVLERIHSAKLSWVFHLRTLLAAHALGVV